MKRIASGMVAALAARHQSRSQIKVQFDRPCASEPQCLSGKKSLCFKSLFVIPAKAGTHLSAAAQAGTWAPAFAGMTLKESNYLVPLVLFPDGLSGAPSIMRV